MEASVQPTEERFDREVTEEVIARRRKLFDKYVKPHLNLIYWCCKQYSDHYSNVEENYTQSLTNLFRGIETYDPEKPIATWLHFVTKRFVWNLNKRRYEDLNHKDDSVDLSYCMGDLDESETTWKSLTPHNFTEFYNDDILAILNELKPMYRDALILQQAGYTLAEIADIEHDRGRLEPRNIDTVKSRLFVARQYMRERLTRDGKRKTDKADLKGLHSHN